MNNAQKTKWHTVGHYGLLAVFLLFSVTLQSAVGGGIKLFGIPTLPAVALVAAVGMNYGPFLGGIFGAITGLFLDVYTVPSVGFHLVVITLLGLGCGLAVNHLLLQNRYARFVLCLVSALFYNTAYFVVLKWILGGHDITYFFRYSLPTTAVCTITVLVYMLFLRWYQKRL